LKNLGRMGERMTTPVVGERFCWAGKYE